MNDREAEKMAGVLYEAHREAMARRSVSGAGIPEWEDLKIAPLSLYGLKAQQAVQNQLRVRKAWVAVAKASGKYQVVDVLPEPEKAPEKKEEVKKAAKKVPKKGKRKLPRGATKKKAAKRSR